MKNVLFKSVREDVKSSLITTSAINPLNRKGEDDVKYSVMKIHLTNDFKVLTLIQWLKFVYF